MKNSISPTCLAALSLAASAFAEPAAPPDWQRLLDGNARFASGQLQHPRQDVEQRAAVAAGQKPFAIVIGCADSRTAPEILFDQGLGDLFVVRLAGNIVDDAALGSIEYAVENLGAKLIVVLGHEKCGAVTAALKALKDSAAPHGHIGVIVEAIKPAADSVKAQAGDPVDNAVRANVHSVVEHLKSSSPVLAPLVQSGALNIVGARYDLDDGKVQPVP